MENYSRGNLSAPSKAGSSTEGIDVEFETKAFINRPQEDVFAFFRDMHQLPRREGSVVPVYDKITQGPVGVGTRIREVVRLLPLVRGEIISEIAEYDPPHRLDYRFVAFGKMDGELTFRLEPVGEGVQLLQRQTLRPRGTVLKVLSPLIAAMFSRAIDHRLRGIKKLLEDEDSP
jgi:hypothetical protein